MTNHLAKERKGQKNMWNRIIAEISRNFVIHLIYAIALLLVAVYFLITIQFSRIPDLKDIINFAVGFASFILAIVAIFQTIISGGGLNKILGVAISSSEEVRRAASELASSIAPASERISAASENLTEHSHQIKEQTEQVARILSSVQEKLESHFEEQKDLLNNIGQRVNINQTDSENSQHHESSKEQWDIAELTSRITLGGAAALYCSMKSEKTGKQISRSKIAPTKEVGNYILGYIAALSSIGIIDYDRIDGEILITNIRISDEQKIKFIADSEELIEANSNNIKLSDGKKRKAFLLSSVKRYFDDLENSAEEE